MRGDELAMINMEKVKSFKYTPQQFKIPYDTSAKGFNSQIIVLQPSTDKVFQGIRSLYTPSAIYKRYYRPAKWVQKIFTHMGRVRLDPTELKKSAKAALDLKMLFLSKPGMIHNRNVVIDTSDFHSMFSVASAGRPYRIVCQKYFDALKYFLTTNLSGVSSTHKYILIDIYSWDLTDKDVKDSLAISNKMTNPISMIYFLMRKNHTAFKTFFSGYRFIITDETQGGFYFDADEITKESHTLFKTALKRCHDSEIFDAIDTKAEEEDKNTSPETLSDELKDAKANTIMKVGDPDDPEDRSTLVDIGDDEPVVQNVNNDNDEGEDSLDDDEDDSDNSESKPEDEDETEIKDEPSTDSEEEEEAESDVDDKELQKELARLNHEKMNRTSTANSARNEELRKKQLKLKLEKISIGELDEVPDVDIETVDISKKIFSTNENVKKVKFDNFNKSYNEGMMEKDILNVFRSLNDKTIPVYITDMKVEDTSTAMDLKKTYTIKLEDENRVRHSLTVDLPVVYDNNYLYLGGNRKQFVNQLFLKPIVKIAPDTVQICTDFKKIFVYRYGENLSPKIELFKKIILAQENAKYFKVRRGNGVALSRSVKTTIEYDAIAKDVITINARKSSNIYSFDQTFYAEQEKLGVLKGTRGDNEIIIGYNSINKTIITIDSNSGKNIIGDIIDNFCQDFKNVYGFELWDLANGQKPGKRFMYTYCKIMAKNIPMVLLLGYYEGLSTTLRKANIGYQFSDTHPKNISKEKGIIQFADGYLIFDRYPMENSLLLNGLSLVDTKGYPFADFDDVGVYLDIFDALYNNRTLASGLDSFYDNMIDPIAKQTLSQMGFPTDLHGLLLAANILLADNSYSSEIDMSHFRVRNNEMISAILYKVVADAFSKYKRTAKNRNPVKISVPKDAVIKELMGLQNLEDYSVINPITEKEKLRSISAKGPSGINKERAYTQEKRSFDESMIGLMAISTSPDKNCGVVRELTVEPKIMDARGFIDVQKDKKDVNDANAFSYAEALTPLGVSRDDSIRTAMATKQSKHIIPVSDMSPVLISSGVEKTLPYTISKDFAVKAEADGVVDTIDMNSGMMIVQYKGGKKEAINLNSVVVKNGAGGFYLSNKLQTKYREGQSFKQGDIIAINDTFFSEHFDGHKYNIGTLSKVACLSSFGTFEDSKLITKKLSERMATEMVMNKHIILGPNATVDYIIKKGAKLQVGDKLISYEQSNSEVMVNDLLANIGDELKEEIVNLGKSQLKSKYTGVVEDIRIYSTVPLEELSPSLRKIVEGYWKDVRKRKSLIKKHKITDATYSGQTYYELDEPIKPGIDGKVKGYTVDKGIVIEFFIKFYDPVGVGDKLVDFAALKGIVCDVIPEGQEPYTVGRPDEEISTLFPANSVLARKVPSILITMFGNKMIIGLTERLKEIYYDKK